ncbi:uncharacterized protein FOMMEDRAFT_150578 [Fomitiporia mediterranea MF3/22]|uniref:uncharacterized protein n=1 Tax=Fomitiporia mediterranea (strain MF3/22) TaxID=694068 RepID=UPI0004407F4B|nr:uncharacterized protein FOMMEDRAFT_150578 [Fomitiporia mediterranea MF3/22]EJD07967.1 hypothetical protein FOMMEDRAFT_150578 [Fomitiporia mediterranea MF3/22]
MNVGLARRPQRRARCRFPGHGLVLLFGAKLVEMSFALGLEEVQELKEAPTGTCGVFTTQIRLPGKSDQSGQKKTLLVRYFVELTTIAPARSLTGPIH